MFRVVWAPQTVREVARIHDYIATFNPRAAADLAVRLYGAGNSLAENPDRGRPVQGTSLRELVVVYPYIIRYQVAGDVVRILRVRHGMRSPLSDPPRYLRHDPSKSHPSGRPRHQALRRSLPRCDLWRALDLGTAQGW